MLLSRGRILAQGPPREVLTPALVGRLFDVPPRAGGADPRVGNDSTPMTRSLLSRARAAGRRAVFRRRWSLAVLAAPFIGSTSIRFGACFSTAMPFADNVDAQIFFIARLPRALAAALVGGTLAAAGVVFQGLLRNPLATPYTLGVSAGASLGAMVAITFGAALPVGGVAVGEPGRRVPGRRHRLRAGQRAASRPVDDRAAARRRDAERVLLGADSVRAVPQRLRADVPRAALADGRPRRRGLRADPGGPAAGRDRVRRVRVAGAAAEPAQHRRGGRRHARRQRRRARSGSRSSAASLATGAAVSVGGPIGFVGIIVPHLVRLIVGADHRLVLPASTFFGAAFLVACDVIARTVLAPLELPVGIITAIIGGPFFLWLLMRNR